MDPRSIQSLMEKLQPIESNLFHKLIGYGSCNLHIVHGSLKTGAENSGWKLRRILKGAFQILHDIPARRED